MSLSRTFLRGLLESEEGQQRLKEIWDEVTTKRTQTFWVHVTERQVDSKGHVVKQRQVRTPVEIEVYPLKDLDRILALALSYGVGKPPEEKTVTVNVTARRLQDASDEELDAIIEGRARELAAGS